MTLDELINAMEPQARKDKALISKCVDGLTEYAAELRQKAGDAGKEQISALRRLVDELAGYADKQELEEAIIRRHYASSIEDEENQVDQGAAAAGGLSQGMRPEANRRKPALRP